MEAIERAMQLVNINFRYSPQPIMYLQIIWSIETTNTQW